MSNEKEIIDCHYCEYACCDDATGWCLCYADDGGYFDHGVKDSKKEAEECSDFKFCNIFPKS